VNAPDIHGDTALTQASSDETIELLKKSGAKP